MPNWCQNILEITGNTADLESFTGVAEDNKFSLETYYPYETEDGDWDYTWCINNWGTKWDVSEQGGMFLIAEGEEVPVNSITLVINNNRISISFLTAWGPPESAIMHISGNHPKLEFKLIYAEAGNNFAGTTSVSAGNLIMQEEGKFEDYIKIYDFNNAY